MKLPPLGPKQFPQMLLPTKQFPQTQPQPLPFFPPTPSSSTAADLHLQRQREAAQRFGIQQSKDKIDVTMSPSAQALSRLTPKQAITQGLAIQQSSPPNLGFSQVSLTYKLC